MEESKEIKRLFSFLQGFIYVSIIVEIAVIFYAYAPWWGAAHVIITKFAKIPMYHNIFYSKLFTLFIIMLTSLGTLAKKDLALDPKKHIVYPMLFGFTLFFGSILFYYYYYPLVIFSKVSLFDLLYLGSSMSGAIFVHTSFDNISKIIKSGLGKDKWNTENESFEQPRTPSEHKDSVNIPMLFYYKKKINKGYIRIQNVFRGILLIGTPGSGKTYSIIVPYIKQLLSKGFSMLVYDFKDPDLGELTYYHYQLNKKAGALKKHNFYAINLNNLEKSCRVNPLNSKYITKLADASETAEALVESLRKGDKAGGADQFFTQSAINFLASIIYFLSKYENGKYSTLPHVLAFLNRSYAEIFDVLFTEIELTSLLDPFRTAYQNKSYDQLEGQLGTLKINTSRMATLETFWVFSEETFDLKISNPESPSIVVLANQENTQSTNSACYSVVLNRIKSLVNTKNNVPVAIVVDEVPTLYIHKIANLIATARSNKVAVLLGLQEIPQFKETYGRDGADTIASVCGHILSGSARNKETLTWLEQLFGKVKQLSHSMSIDRAKTSITINEKTDYLIPASKIANLRTSEIVGMIAQDVNENYDGQYNTSAINCKVNLDVKAIDQEVKRYTEMPKFYTFGTSQEKQQILRNNFFKIIKEVEEIVESFYL